MLKTSEYAAMDGMDLAEAIQSGAVSRDEVVDAAERAFEAVDKSLNSIVRPLFQLARENQQPAQQGDAPLDGAPIVLKDEYQSVAGVPTDQAARLAKGWCRSYDTEIVRRYRAAGIQIVGKANLPEFGASVTTEPVLTGRTSTPWSSKHNSGGSSGGPAAAVASGIVPLAYATDGAGSIRIPASCCGAFGLKPSRGRTPTGPDGYEYWNGLCLEHAITRSVRDSAALLDATDGIDIGAPYAAPPKERPFLAEVTGRPRKLRIGYSTRAPDGSAVHPDCVAAVEETARLCADLGHNLEEAQPHFDSGAMVGSMKTLLRVHLALGVRDLAGEEGVDAKADLVEHAHLDLARQGLQIGAADFLAALEQLGRVARQASYFWQDYDVWLTPTLAEPPLEHGTISANDENSVRYIDSYFRFVPFTPLANVTGNPAMTVPLHWNAADLPVGTHFTAAFGREDQLFNLAGQLEAARPWRQRIPPVSAARVGQTQA